MTHKNIIALCLKIETTCITIMEWGVCLIVIAIIASLLIHNRVTAYELLFFGALALTFFSNFICFITFEIRTRCAAPC